MATSVTEREARAHFAALADRVRQTGEPVIVEKDGSPIVAMVWGWGADRIAEWLGLPLDVDAVVRQREHPGVRLWVGCACAEQLQQCQDRFLHSHLTVRGLTTFDSRQVPPRQRWQ